MAIHPGDIISYAELCVEEGSNVQRGMNFRIKGQETIILMSIRPGAPYADRVEENGKVLIYEGHDVPKNQARIPKAVDQVDRSPIGTLTENGKFFRAAANYKEGKDPAELIKVYEKIKKGIWVYNGLFYLVDAWIEKSEGRNVFKFKLLVTDQTAKIRANNIKKLQDLVHNRIIPTSVKLEVWKRDGGKCVQCGSTDNLHFDHDVPFAKGGSSLTAANIKLLCARHNLQKSDKIV